MSPTSAAGAEHPWPRSEPPGLTPDPEQIQLREALRGLLGKYSDIEQVRAAADTGPGYSPQLWRILVDEMSVTSLAVPEDNGGLGYGTAELAVVLEECGRALVCEPVYSSAVLGTQALLTAPEAEGNPLPDVLAGNLVATMSSLGRATDDLRAAPSPHGWRVGGAVTHLIGGHGADIVIASAETADGPRLFALRPPEDALRTELRVLDPTRRQADLSVRDCPAVALTTADTTATVRTRLRDLATLALACENTGIVERLLEMTVGYAGTRHQFGRAIGSFQAVKHRLADLLVSLERARSASRYAAALYAEDPDSARLAVAVAGAVCTDAAVHAAAEAVQLHGGVGFTWEHPAHSYFRRALGNEAAQGDARNHRARIAALIGV
ncbi:acyl-CoA dehydrogenase family protein [Nocardia flavorosea]|uniref:acyl-CoA dehydrogenase family protein n=1 Tax=Nocardia flavorosea TaxID=53429 RepID=UPI001895CBB6|nr:acyl-CoA dehydrogenase family protein [Nocardia flavorosea]MBF6348274.1 acyl-CoA dehydrogenase family protein [Nocardia flavorosea]